MKRGLCEDVANLRFGLGVESSASETEHVLVMFRNLKSKKTKKAVSVSQ
jgi:hypothetical protein